MVGGENGAVQRFPASSRSQGRRVGLALSLGFLHGCVEQA